VDRRRAAHPKTDRGAEFACLGEFGYTLRLCRIRRGFSMANPLEFY
jgi:hypothetical protein